ncbi:unnamed protein product, partial [Didymodactylos carnosus]
MVDYTDDTLQKAEKNLNSTKGRISQLVSIEQTFNSTIRNSIEVIAIETERNLKEFLPKYLDEFIQDLDTLSTNFENYTQNKQELPVGTRTTA